MGCDLQTSLSVRAVLIQGPGSTFTPLQMGEQFSQQGNPPALQKFPNGFGRVLIIFGKCEIFT